MKKERVKTLRRTFQSKYVKLLTTGFLSLSLFLSGCGSAPSTSSGDAGGKNQTAKKEEAADKTDKGDQIKLRIAWAGDQSRHDVTLKAISLYEKAHPNVKFVPEYSGWDGYWDKMATQFAANNGPDIIQIDTFNLLEYAGRNQLADLSSGIKLDKVDPNLVSGGKSNGKQFGIPIGNNAITLFYNKKVFDSLGVNFPTNGISWDDLIKLAREIQPKLPKGKYVMHDLSIQPVTGNGTDAYEIFQISKGKGFLHTPDGKFNVDKDTLKEWVDLFKQLRKEGIVPPPDVEMAHKQQDPKQDLLVNGTVLLTQSYAATFTGYESMLPNTLSMSVVPSSKQFGGYLVPAQFFAVSASSKHVEEAKQFIDWFINDPSAGEALGFNRGVPVSNDVLKHLEPKMSASDKLVTGMVDQTAKIANPFSSRPPGYNNFRTDFARAMEEIAFGKQTVDQAYDQLKDSYKETIKEVK